MSRPYRALYSLLRAPRALPWAGMFSPFRAILNTLKGCDIPARGNAPGMFGKKNIRPVGAGHSVSDGEGLCSALTGLNLFVMSVPGALPRAGMCSPFRAGETFKGRRLRAAFEGRRLRVAFKGIGPGGAILNTLKGCDIPARGNAPGMFGKKNIRPVGAGHSYGTVVI